MITKADVDKAFKAGFADAKRKAYDVAQFEVAAAEKELGYAKKPKSTFNQVNIAATQMRLRYAKNIRAAIGRIKPLAVS